MKPYPAPTHSRDSLLAKTTSEGYCCIYGYLRLCKARGEKPPDMAKWIGVHRYTIYYYYRAIRNGTCTCQAYSTCQLPDILAVEKLAAPTDTSSSNSSSTEKNEKPGE